jgi:hypothetical protein
MRHKTKGADLFAGVLVEPGIRLMPDTISAASAAYGSRVVVTPAMFPWCTPSGLTSSILSASSRRRCFRTGERLPPNSDTPLLPEGGDGHRSAAASAK